MYAALYPQSGSTVLGADNAQNGLNVQVVEGAFVGKSTLLVSDVQCAIVEPDVGLDAECSDGKCAVEGDRAPVVVMAMERLGHDALGEVGRVGVEWSLLSVREDVLEGLRERDVGLGVGCGREGGGEESGEHL